MRQDILEMFQVPTRDLRADNDLWIIDPDLYPSDLFDILPERRPKTGKKGQLFQSERTLLSFLTSDKP